MGVLPFVLLALLALAPSPLLASKPKSPAHNARSLRHPPGHPRHSRRSASTACPSAGTVGVYWPAWSTGVQPPGNLSWDKVDLAFYVLVETTSSGIGIPQGQTKDDIKLFVKEAHAAEKKALFTVGGWSGSVYFSKLVSTGPSRTRFAKTLFTFMNSYGFDGVDLDWEFVGKQGAGTNVVAPNDAANLLKFLAALRGTVGPAKLLHASVPTSGFTGSDGKPLEATKPYSQYLDYITIMAYDMYASSRSPTTGPNAPIARCNAVSGSVTAAVALWTNTGFPACQILLGVPSSSHLFRTASSKVSTTFYQNKKSKTFQALANSTLQPVDPTYTYAQLVSNGWLTTNGSAGAGGYARYFDECTLTPFLFNSKQRLFVAYDDATSIGFKAAFVKANGLAGVNFYSSLGSDNGIVDAARSGLQGTFVATRRRDGWAEKLPEDGAFEGALADNDLMELVDDGKIPGTTMQLVLGSG